MNFEEFRMGMKVKVARKLGGGSPWSPFIGKVLTLKEVCGDRDWITVEETPYTFPFECLEHVSNPEKEWKARRADKLAELLAQVADLQAEIEEETKPKKRLMTPQECAGKWITNPGVRTQVTGFTDVDVSGIGMTHFTIKALHADGWKIADTPTSEPYSLEVDACDA